jgi:hypothetical protein
MTKNAADLYRESTEFQFEVPEIPMGPWTSYSLTYDPKHLSFVLARYKFAAKMLHGRARVMEVGSGDGFGLPIVAQAVGHVHCVDWDQRLLDGNARRLKHLTNVTYTKADLNKEAPPVQVDAAYWIDVLEHLDAASETTMLDNIIKCLPAEGVLLTGTPNKAASQYASPQSEVAHINLKTLEELRALMQQRFHNVFMFGMNDEVLHTGYGPMCHYIWALAVGVKRAG